MIFRVLTITILVFFGPYLSAQNTLLPVVRQFDVSSNILKDGCAAYNSNYFDLAFDLSQRGEQYVLDITSAGGISDVNTLAPLAVNQDNFKDCSMISTDWSDKIYYNISGLQLIDNVTDLQQPYDIRAVGDLYDLSAGFEITAACPSESSASQYLRCIKSNIPNNSPEIYILLSDSEAIPKETLEDYKQILDWLIQMGLGYDRFIHILYDLDGDNTEALASLQNFALTDNKGKPVTTIEGVHDQRSCLSGFASFGDFGSRKKDWDFCIQPNPYTDDYWENDKQTAGDGFLYHILHGWLHEYFHHTQRAHTLERSLGTRADCCGLHNPIEAPPFWIEGAASMFPDMFLWEKFDQLNHTIRNGFKRGRPGSSYRQSDSPVVCQGHAFYLCDQGYEFFKTEKQRIQEAGGVCYLGARDSTGIVDGIKREPQCDWRLAAYYLAFYTSHQIMLVDIPRDMWSLGFPAAFEKHVGLTIDEFAEKYSEFMNSGSPDEPPPDGFYSNQPLSELVDFWSLKTNPSGQNLH